jgi:hypothetical protein
MNTGAYLLYGKYIENGKVLKISIMQNEGLIMWCVLAKKLQK